MHIHPDILLLSILAFGNICLIVKIISDRVKKKIVNRDLLDTVRDVGHLAIAIGAFITFFGLTQALGDLEQRTEMLPINVILGGLNASIPSLLHGLAVYFFSMCSHILLKHTIK